MENVKLWHLACSHWALQDAGSSPPHAKHDGKLQYYVATHADTTAIFCWTELLEAEIGTEHTSVLCTKKINWKHTDLNRAIRFNHVHRNYARMYKRTAVGKLQHGKEIVINIQHCRVAQDTVANFILFSGHGDDKSRGLDYHQ